MNRPLEYSSNVGIKNVRDTQKSGFHACAHGFAAGMLMSIFILTSWKDLSQSGTNKKCYAIGSIPLFATNLVPVFLFSYIAPIPASAVSSVASFLLFLPVLPLIYALETLPEKKKSG